jgi:hypothetical protein
VKADMMLEMNTKFADTKADTTKKFGYLEDGRFVANLIQFGAPIAAGRIGISILRGCLEITKDLIWLLS